MSLSQDDRISISKKIVAIPLQNALADQTIAQIEVEKQKAQKEDDANKQLMIDSSVLIDAYQPEFSNYDGNGRNQLMEQDLIDSVNRKFQSFFFPNDSLTPILPAVPDGIWKNFVAFAGSKAIGKNYNGTYTTVPGEIPIIADITAKIAVVESFSNITRSTGQSCAADVIADDPAMQAAGTNLINAVQDWKNLLVATYSIIVTTDTDPTRSAQNIAAKADITTTTPTIDTWLARPTYDTSHGQIDCAGFNSYNVNLLAATKFRAAELLPIKNLLITRQSFVTTRVSQLNTNLGTIVQNASTGELTTTTGFYGYRMRVIDVRINAMGGSLGKVKGLERGQAAQEEGKKSNDNAAIVYAAVMAASGFRAPSTGSSTIHVLDASGFSISDAVYVCADKQEEIATTITNIQGNTVFLATKVPQKYRQNEFARLYKVL